MIRNTTQKINFTKQNDFGYKRLSIIIVEKNVGICAEKKVEIGQKWETATQNKNKRINMIGTIESHNFSNTDIHHLITFLWAAIRWSQKTSKAKHNNWLPITKEIKVWVSL